MRPIDAEALIRRAIERYKEMMGTDIGHGMGIIASMITDAKTIDAVPVVRCEDCKHRRNDEDYVCGHYCVKRPSNGGYFCEDDDFCSYGERRGE